MPATRHDIYHEFPEHTARIQELLSSSTHFSALVDRYHEVDRTVHAMESTRFAIHDDAEPFKRKRLKLKDQLYSYIQDTRLG